MREEIDMKGKIAPDIPESGEPFDEYENPFVTGLMEQIRNTLLNRTHNARIPVIKVVDLPELEAQKPIKAEAQ